MLSGNEFLILLIMLSLAGLIVWGLYLLIRKAVQSETERAQHDG